MLGLCEYFVSGGGDTHFLLLYYLGENKNILIQSVPKYSSKTVMDNSLAYIVLFSDEEFFLVLNIKNMKIIPN